MISRKGIYELLPFDDSTLDVFTFDLVVHDIHDGFRKTLIRLGIEGLIQESPCFTTVAFCTHHHGIGSARGDCLQSVEERRR